MLRLRPVLREEGDASARGHEELVTAELYGPANCIEQLLGDDAARVDVAHSGKQER